MALPAIIPEWQTGPAHRRPKTAPRHRTGTADDGILDASYHVDARGETYRVLLADEQLWPDAETHGTVYVFFQNGRRRLYGTNGMAEQPLSGSVDDLLDAGGVTRQHLPIVRRLAREFYTR